MKRCGLISAMAGAAVLCLSAGSASAGISERTIHAVDIGGDIIQDIFAEAKANQVHDMESMAIEYLEPGVELVLSKDPASPSTINGLVVGASVFDTRLEPVRLGCSLDTKAGYRMAMRC